MGSKKDETASAADFSTLLPTMRNLKLRVINQWLSFNRFQQPKIPIRQFGNLGEMCHIAHELSFNPRVENCSYYG